MQSFKWIVYVEFPLQWVLRVSVAWELTHVLLSIISQLKITPLDVK